MKNEEWKECLLGDFIELHRGYDLTKTSIVKGPYPVVCSTSIMGYHNEFKVKGPGVVIGRSGTLGEVQYVTCDYWPHNTSLYVSDFKGNDPKFVKYFLQRFGTGNVGSGSAVPTLNRNHIQALSIKVPPLAKQKEIANILSALDDKIELNNAINRNLEEQVKSLYTKLFITEKNGKMGILGDLVKVKYGKDHKKLSDGTFPVYGSGGIMRYANQYLYDKESVLIPRKGTLNNVIYVNEPFWSVDTMFYTEMKQENIAKYVYLFLSEKNLESLNAGSAVPSMTTDILNAMPILIPVADSLEKFEDFAAPIYSKIAENNKENKKLALLRDSLLPKLMSGEINVA